MSDDESQKFNLDLVTGIYAEYDQRTFAFYERNLKVDDRFWPTGDQIVMVLQGNSKHPIPPRLARHIAQRLDGTAKKRRGRKNTSLRPSLKQLLVPIYYDRFLKWLQNRSKKQGLDGWRLIRDAHWWQGPPHERAARMVQARFKLPIDWRLVLNQISKERS